MLFALAGAVGCLAYVLTDQRRKAKKPVYAIASIELLYVAIIYGLGAFGVDVYLLKTGWLGAIGYYLLISTFGALIITDWRKR